MTRIFFGFVFGMFSIGLLPADCRVSVQPCRQRAAVQQKAKVVQQKVNVVQQKVVEQKAAVQAVVLPLVNAFVPSYTASYSAGYTQQHDESTKAIVEALGRIEQRLIAIETKINVSAATGSTGGAVHYKLMLTHCASCHEASVAKAKGGNNAFISGTKLREFTPEDLGAIIKQVSSGKMPKGGKMTEQERLQMIGSLTADK